MIRLGDRAASAAANAVTALCDGAPLLIHDEYGRVLVELRFSSPAFGPSEAGIAKVNPVPSATAQVTGIATWFETSAFRGSVGILGTDLILTTAYIEAGAQVTVGDLVYQQAPE